MGFICFSLFVTYVVFRLYDITGDVESYISRFSDDLDNFIESASSVDLMTTLGILQTPLEPRAAQDIVYDAMRLDLSARNKIPTSCSIWIGTRMLPVTVTMKHIGRPKLAVNVTMSFFLCLSVVY